MSNRPPADPSPNGTPPVVLHSGLASYELLRSLGQGHHGELLLTRQRYPDGVGAYTVLKRLNRVVRQEDYQRLVEEARLGGYLRHPNIVSVQQLGGSPAEPLLLLEYVEGQTLGELMRVASRAGRPLTGSLALHVTCEVADALHYAHGVLDEQGRALGIVHRDVTPRGIVIGRWGEVKLLDFGGAWSRLEGRISTEGDSDLGNLAYASPERAGLEELDGRSDLFSLGLVLLELLTGHHLLETSARHEAERLNRELRPRGDSVRGPGLEELSAASTAELMKRVRELRPQRVKAALQGLPEGLRTVLQRALAPRREDRYASVGELSQALRGYAGREGTIYGRAELRAEVATLTEAALDELEASAGPSRRGRGGARARRAGPEGES